jgi:hypothetical protein
MVRKAVRSVGAALTLVVLGALVVPGCVIKLGKGGGPDEKGSASGAGGTGGQGAGTGGQGAGTEDPFQNADPAQVVREGLKASAASYLAQGTVEQAIVLQGIDPATLDATTAQQLIDDAWPGAVDQAEAWLSTLDPSAFEAAVHPSAAYCSGLGCPSKIWCDSKYYNKSIACNLQACGDAACKACPDWFGPLKHLVIQAWCSYVCMDGDTVLGSAAYVVTPWDGYQYCILP